MSNLRKETLHATKWSSVGTFTNFAVNFGLGVILARLLEPSDYGIVGMTAIFFSIAYIFIDGGLGVALIQRKDLTEEDCSTVFYFNIAASTTAYLLLFFGSPYIAEYLCVPILKDIIRVSALSMVIGSFGSIHHALLTKNIQFKSKTILSVANNILCAILGIYMAYDGYGVWALVWPNIITCIVGTIAIWFISSWRPKLIFSIKSFKSMFSFSGNLVINSILDTFYNEGTSMVIGRFYTPQTLGYYNKGQSSAHLPSLLLSRIVSGVSLPILAKIQDDNEYLVQIYSKYIRMMSLVVFFATILLFALARPFTLFLYSDRWEPAVIFMQLFCMRYMLFHIHALNWNLLLVKGRTDIALKKEIINKTIRFTLLISSIPFGVVIICLAQIVGTISDLFVNTYFAGRVCGMGFKQQASDFVPYLLLSVVSCMPAYLLSYSNFHVLASLIIGVFVSIMLYWGFLWLRKDDCLLSLIELTPLRKLISNGYIAKSKKLG